MIDLIIDFISHEGVGITLGVVVASGMIIGTSMIYLGMGWRQILGWIIAFFVLMTFVEIIRLDVLTDHGHPYTTRPALTLMIPFFFYVVGIIPGALIGKHYCVNEEDVLEEMLVQYKIQNGNGAD